VSPTEGAGAGVVVNERRPKETFLLGVETEIEEAYGWEACCEKRSRWGEDRIYSWSIGEFPRQASGRAQSSRMVDPREKEKISIGSFFRLGFLQLGWTLDRGENENAIWRREQTNWGPFR
jgi:hypothetical protein